MVEIVKFLGTFISQDVTWTVHITSLVKKAQQWLCFQLLLFFCHCSVESILTYGILARYASCTAADKKH